jgi:hypothetical protein
VLRGKSIRRLHRALAVLAFSVLFPAADVLPFLIAGSNPHCCRTKARCCCGKHASGGAVVSPAASCQSSCGFAALGATASLADAVKRPAEAALSPAGTHIAARSFVRVRSAVSPLLYQRPPPFIA